MTYEIQLDSFQGPLEVLYQLIKKNRVEISEISLASIAEQYLSYMDKLKEFNLDLASEFMVIAAELIELKLKVILPRNNIDDDNDDDESNLVQRLQEYHYFKKVSNLLQEYEEQSSKFHSRAVDISTFIDSEFEVQLDIELSELEDAYKNVLAAVLKREEAEDEEEKEERDWEQLNFEEIKIEDKTEYIMNKLSNTSYGISFANLLVDHRNKLEVVVTFLSILELAKLSKVRIKQDRIFSNIELHK
ncbi:segregation and condensation protein A [Natronospora cellulosivora (SeqCode)]